jgi:hypothetical protein
LCSGGESMLFYSIRRTSGDVAPLRGPRLERGLPIAAKHDVQLLGQIDWVEAGNVSGWACVRDSPSTRPLQVGVLLLPETCVCVLGGGGHAVNRSLAATVK